MILELLSTTIDRRLKRAQPRDLHFKSLQFYDDIFSGFFPENEILQIAYIHIRVMFSKTQNDTMCSRSVLLRSASFFYNRLPLDIEEGEKLF